MKYGYARVSTDNQKADLQIAALKEGGCGHVFTDTASGKRPELSHCLVSLRSVDNLIAWKLDRLDLYMFDPLGHLVDNAISYPH